jgi:hypothetical protein
MPRYAGPPPEPYVPPDDVDPRYEFGGPLPEGPPPSKRGPAKTLGVLLILFVIIFAGLAASIIISIETGNDYPRAPRIEQVDDPARCGPE